MSASIPPKISCEPLEIFDPHRSAPTIWFADTTSRYLQLFHSHLCLHESLSDHLRIKATLTKTISCLNALNGALISHKMNHPEDKATLKALKIAIKTDKKSIKKLENALSKCDGLPKR